jgi:hypothetical protein
MNAPNDRHAANGLRARLRGWWLSPPRAGLQRWINPWEYRRLRFSGVARVFGGGVQVAAGLICLVYGVDGWAAFFLVLGALNLGGGAWFLSLDRSAPAQA